MEEGDSKIKTKFQRPRGTFDILPAEQKYYQKILSTAKEIAHFYGFSRIETPILEKTELFSRGVGISTEIVKKQMFTLKSNKDSLSLRPEGTASVARAFLEDGMRSWSQPVKLWYFGPFFRYERPQAGRFRQFWHVGFEAIGKRNPVIDVQIIQISCAILEELKFKDVVVHVNSIGCPKCRPYSKRLLKDYFRSKRNSLCADCRKRFRENVFRVLDCKEEKCQRVVKGAPQIIDHLCKECHNHFKEVLEFLDELSLPYRLNPYLVRGLDYYTKTVFEVFSKEDDSAFSNNGSQELAEPAQPNSSVETVGLALGGGGRYDGLIKSLGGPDVPAVGMAMGVERIVGKIKDKELRYERRNAPKIFLAQIGRLAKRRGLKLLEEFRKAKIPIVATLDRDSLRIQLERANKVKARYVLILGEKELFEEEIMLRDMKSGKQRTLKLKDLIKDVKKL